jgi:hypothetical protein
MVPGPAHLSCSAPAGGVPDPVGPSRLTEGADGQASRALPPNPAGRVQCDDDVKQGGRQRFSPGCQILGGAARGADFCPHPLRTDLRSTSFSPLATLATETRYGTVYHRGPSLETCSLLLEMNIHKAKELRRCIEEFSSHWRPWRSACP